MFQELTIFILLYLSMFSATVTAYSPANVDPRWQGQARWTGQPPVVGVTVACPIEWKMERVFIQGYGWRVCEDTPKHGWYGEAPHLDIFLSTHQEALYHGVQRLRVWKSRD